MCVTHCPVSTLQGQGILRDYKDAKEMLNLAKRKTIVVLLYIREFS